MKKEKYGNIRVSTTRIKPKSTVPQYTHRCTVQGGGDNATKKTHHVMATDACLPCAPSRKSTGAHMGKNKVLKVNAYDTYPPLRIARGEVTTSLEKKN